MWGDGYFARIVLDSNDHQTQVLAEGHIAALPGNSIFGSLHQASAFFERGSLGYSVTAKPGAFGGRIAGREQFLIRLFHMVLDRWCRRPDEVSREEPPAPLDRLEAETSFLSQPFYGGSGLIMRITRHLRNRQYSPRLERPKTLTEGGSTVGDFPQDGTQEHHVETALGNVRLGGVPEDGRQVRDAGRVRSHSETLDHPWLDVDPHGLAPRQNPLRRWNEKPSRSRTNFQNPLTGPEFHPLEGCLGSAEALKEWTLQTPGQEGGTGQ